MIISGSCPTKVTAIIRLHVKPTQLPSSLFYNQLINDGDHCHFKYTLAYAARRHKKDAKSAVHRHCSYGQGDISLRPCAIFTCAYK